MGASHARAYSHLPGFHIAGIVTRTEESRTSLAKALGDTSIPLFADFHVALKASRPDAVCIASYPDTHAEFALAALDAGCHCFVEKPLADSVEGAEKVVAKANEKNLKVVVGYILRHHPAWEKFIEVAKGLGSPLVMRMSLNQQSSGPTWATHKNLMKSISPIVDCGVHYVDVMLQMTGSKPVRVSGIGARLSDEVAPTMYNYGHLQVTFEDGSVGTYEAGWGPMISQEAFFVKDVIGKNGCVTIVAGRAAKEGQSDNVDGHTATSSLRLHYAALGPDGKFAKKDEFIATGMDPGHDGLCDREQLYFEKTIREDLDLTQHLEDALSSMRIVDAADRSFREGITVKL